MTTDHFLAGKRILIGVTGGIAAYKALDFVSMLRKCDALVKVVMTANAIEFVNPISFEAISGNPVYFQMFSKAGEWEINHISLAKWAEILIVMPATANILGKVNHGIADDLLSTVIMATKAKVIFAPAMNTQMFRNQIVADNIASLKHKGYEFISPATGRLACGDWGEGKLAGVEEIFEGIKRILRLKNDLVGLRVLVTAGPTREYIDPARFISNPSTGKMGYAIAQAVIDRGADCFLVSGPTHLEPPEKASFYSVETAEQMLRVVIELLPQCNLLFKAAAVSDYRPATKSLSKIKKGMKNHSLELLINPDILKMAASLKTKQVIIGFAAETDNIELYAKQKLENKNLDFILVNDISSADAGFGKETNQGVLFTRNGEEIKIPLLRKREFAHRLIDEVMHRCAGLSYSKEGER